MNGKSLKVWIYIQRTMELYDPDEGMTENDFNEDVQNFAEHSFALAKVKVTKIVIA